MKKGICVFLAATLLCVSIAGCSVSGQTESLLEKSQSIGTSDNTSLQANPELSESAYNTDDFYCALEDMAIPDTPILQIQFYDRTTGIITNFESSDDIERIFAILQGLEIQPSVSPTLEIAQQNAGSYYTLRFNKSKNDMQPLYTIDLDPFELQVGNMRTGFLSVANTEEIVAQLQAEATKERWISPTGDYPYTSQAAWEYYEEHPQLQEYYHQYLVPLGYLNGISSWENFDEIPLSLLWTWVWCQLSEEERENVPSLNPLTETLIPFGLIQEKAAA